MSILKRLFGKEEKRATLRDADGWLSLIGGSTTAGITVTAESALSHPAVMGAVRLIAELTASLPLVTYERTSEGRRRAERHPVHRLLHEQPNPQMAPFTFKETLALHLLLHGNAYILVNWADNGSPAALWPLHPSRVQVEIQPGGTVLYKVNTTQGQLVTYATDDVLHVPLLALDGLVGRSPVQLAREAIGAALAAEEHAAAFFANAARPSGVLKTAGVLTPEAAQRLKESWQAAYGRGKAGTAVLEGGVEFETIAGNAQESQLIESRQFAMRAIAAALRIPPHLLDPSARGTYANVETQSLEFLTFSLQPFLTRLEEAFTLKLFTPSERQRYFVEFLTDGLLRADTQTRYTAYQIGVQAGFLTPNEVRQRENLPPLPEPAAPPAPTPPIRREGKAETRDAKQDLQARHRPAIEKAARAVLQREAMEILDLAAKALGQRDTGLLEAGIADYYAEPPEWMGGAFAPAFGALAAEAAEEATREVGGESWDLTEFVGGFLAAYLARHIAISRTTVLGALRTAEADPLEALELVLTEMENTRPGKIASLQTANLANETALETYRRAGVTKIRWRAAARACAFCRNLDGKVVGLGEPFVAAGESIPGPEGDMTRRLTARQPRIRPPIHLGCNCSLQAVRE